MIRANRVVPVLPLLSATLLACGGAPPPPPAAAPAPLAKAPPPAPPPDLSPTPEPEGLVVFARLAKPSEALKVVGTWVHVPMPGAQEIASLVTGDAGGDAIDLDHAIDYAIAMHGPKKRGAISVAVKSMDDAKKAFAKYKLAPAENGAFTIEGLGAGDDEDEEPRFCAIAPAFGAASARLVCADSEDARRELVPWMTRSAPRTTYPADLHIEAHLAPVRPLVDQYRRVLPLFAGGALGIRRGQAPALDEAFRATIEDLADFTGDAETVAVDAMIAEPQATVTVTSAFRGTTSLLARLAVAHPERADAPPATLWKLPADTDAAYFDRGVDATEVDRLRDRIAAVFGAWLEKEGVADADRKAMRDALAHTIDLAAFPGVMGKGLDAAEAQRAIAAIGAAKDDAAREEAERVAAEKLAGWMAIELDAPAAKVAATAKEWATAWSRPGMAKWEKQQSPDAPAPTIKVAPLPKGIAAKDAAHLAIATYRPHHAEKGKKRPAAGKPMVLHVLVVPDGNQTWLVSAADEALAVSTAHAVTSAGGEGKPPLAARASLASMRDARMNAGGFVTPRGVVDGTPFSWALGSWWTEVGKNDDTALAGQPEATTIPFQLVSQPGAGSAPAGTFVAKATVPKEAIEAIVRIAMH